MRKWLFTFVATAMFACLMLLHFPERMIAAAPAHAAVRITAGPELETANSTLAIVRWTTTNPGGTALHYGIVHYGTDATNLSRVAKSPNRRNPPHPDMIFRVRVAGTPTTNRLLLHRRIGRRDWYERRSIQSHKNIQNRIVAILR